MEKTKTTSETVGGAAYRHPTFGSLVTPRILYDLSREGLYCCAKNRGEGAVTKDGALAVSTGAYTGRAASDKFLENGLLPGHAIDWGEVNRPISEHLFAKMAKWHIAQMAKLPELFVSDVWAGADPHHSLAVRIVTERAWHALFARTMFLGGSDEAMAERHATTTRPFFESFAPPFTILHAPSLRAPRELVRTPGKRYERDVTVLNSETYILISMSHRLVLIGGTSYAGEIKKAVFTVMNYLLPERGVLPMHCSVNVGEKGDSAVFFGLSGTGKTTLSADPKRRLVGDDEHGWSDDGLFNLEGGCYAKVIRLSEKGEPAIWKAVHRRGAILENVVLDTDSVTPLFNDEWLTENTRASYPLSFIENREPSGRAGHPENIVMLTCDTFGVLPPIARLTPEQAEYHFLSGYTAKIAGTERDVGKEPIPTFSACFGAPFMPLHPSVYARMLEEKIREYKVACWLVNTGWTGGPYGVGERIPLSATRALLGDVLSGAFGGSTFSSRYGLFRLMVPDACPLAKEAEKFLLPSNIWQRNGTVGFREAEAHLAALFRENFAKKKYHEHVSPEVRAYAESVGV